MSSEKPNNNTGVIGIGFRAAVAFSGWSFVLELTVTPLKRFLSMRPLTSVRVTLQKSKFDKDLERIKELLSLGLSIRKTSKLMGYTNHNGLATYLRKRRWMNLMQKA